MSEKLGLLKKRPREVLLICAITFKTEADFNLICHLLETKYSKIYAISKQIDFSILTPYYEKEMGGELFKCLVSFEKFASLENLHLEKLALHKLEMEHASGNKRIFNLDLGYITLSKFVLFSTKDFFHRVYIGSQIFAEVTLYYNKKNKSFESFYYTYKDYKESYFVDFLNQQRIYFKNNG